MPSMHSPHSFLHLISHKYTLAVPSAEPLATRLRMLVFQDTDMTCITHTAIGEASHA